MNQFINLTQDNKQIIVNVAHIRWIKTNAHSLSSLGIDYYDVKVIFVEESPEEIMSLINTGGSEHTSDLDAIKKEQ